MNNGFAKQCDHLCMASDDEEREICRSLCKVQGVNFAKILIRANLCLGPVLLRSWHFVLPTLYVTIIQSDSINLIRGPRWKATEDHVAWYKYMWLLFLRCVPSSGSNETVAASISKHPQQATRKQQQLRRQATPTSNSISNHEFGE
jgi:hypothetical protein